MKKSVSELKKDLVAANKQIKLAKKSGNKRQLNLGRQKRLSTWRELRDEYGQEPPSHVAKALGAPKKMKKETPAFQKPQKEEPNETVIDFTKFASKAEEKAFFADQARAMGETKLAKKIEMPKKKEVYPGKFEELTSQQVAAAERWLEKNVSEYDKTQYLKKSLASGDRTAVAFLRKATEKDPLLKHAFNISYTTYSKMIKHLEKKMDSLIKMRKNYEKKFSGKKLSHFIALYNNRLTKTQLEINRFRKLLRSRVAEAKKIGHTCKVISKEEIKEKIAKLRKGSRRKRALDILNDRFAEELQEIEEEINEQMEGADAEDKKEIQNEVSQLRKARKDLKRGASISNALTRSGITDEINAKIREAAALRKYKDDITTQLAMAETRAGGGVKLARGKQKKGKKRGKPVRIARASKRKRDKEAKA